MLQRLGVFEGGQAKESYSVIPGSGTGDLQGLQGDGSTAVGHGMEHPFTLDYDCTARPDPVTAGPRRAGSRLTNAPASGLISPPHSLKYLPSYPLYQKGLCRMRPVFRVLPTHCAAAAIVFLGACCSDPGACTLNIEPAITVRALDAATGENVTDGARGTVSEGGYADSLRPAEFDVTQRVLMLSGADPAARYVRPVPGTRRISSRIAAWPRSQGR